MSDLTWHMHIVIKPDTRPPQGAFGARPPVPGYGRPPIPQARPNIVKIQFQDGAGLRSPTEAELAETKEVGLGIQYYALNAAWLEGFKADRHLTEKKYYLVSHPKADGAYEAELHLDALGGPLLRKSKALDRIRAAELLTCQENSLGAISVTEV